MVHAGAKSGTRCVHVGPAEPPDHADSSALDPRPGATELIGVKDLDLSLHEKTAQLDAPFDPSRTADHRDLAEIGPVLDAVGRVVPGRVEVLSFKGLVHIKQYVEPSSLLEEGRQLGDQDLFVIGIR